MSVLNDASLIGRKGAVSLDDAALAACQLGRFTRGQLADELGVKPVAVGRFVSSLLEVDAILIDDSLMFRWMGDELPEPQEPEPEPEPDVDVDAIEHRALLHACRDAVRDLQRFTIGEIADYLGVEKAEAKRYLAELPDGMVTDTGKTWKRSPLYEYAPPPGETPKNRPAPPAPEVAAISEFVKRGEVKHGGCPRVSPRKDVQALVEQAWRAGWPVKPARNGGHAMILPPKGRPITVPGTPSTGMIRVLRDRLQDAGLNVKKRRVRS